MDFYISLRQLAELVGISYESVRRWPITHKEYQRRQLGPFPTPHGTVLAPGRQGARAPVFLMSEVFDWLAENRPYDLRHALQLGEVGRVVARLEERQRERQSSKASRVTSEASSKT